MAGEVPAPPSARSRALRRPFVATVLVVDAVLETSDAAGFAGLASAAVPPPAGRELVVLAALIGPRVVLAACCAVVVAALLRGRRWAVPSAVVLTVVVAAQAATAMFLLDGTGQHPATRVALATANAGAALVAGADRRRLGSRRGV